MTIGDTIQRLRTKRRLSQEQLAELVGVSRQAVSKWELNAALPDTDKLVPLARALGVSVDELLGNVDAVAVLIDHPQDALELALGDPDLPCDAIPISLQSRSPHSLHRRPRP